MRKTESNGENDSMQTECAKMNATMREWTVTRENNKKISNDTENHQMDKILKCCSFEIYSKTFQCWFLCN